jgi:UDP-glucuronate 4-epimerase
VAGLAEQRILVTGAAGFIGFHLCTWLAKHGYRVTGLDSIDAYYDVGLKYGRLEQLGIPRDQVVEKRRVASATLPGLEFVQADVCDLEHLEALFRAQRFALVCHLAAQAGVRYSLQDPHKYVQSNLVGFMNILEACRHQKVGHLVYASSSSVYGLNQKVPFSVRDNADHPISIYAATKKSNELMAHCYSYLYGLPTTGLRFFTVYGPWGRPDMALFKFTKAILHGEPIEVYNHGEMVRDFTYVDDVVEGIGRVLAKVPAPAAAWDGLSPRPDLSPAPYRLFNLGNNSPVRLLDFIAALEEELGRKAEVRLLPLQPGDVPATRADVAELEEATGFRPATPVRQGIRAFVAWYRSFFPG